MSEPRGRELVIEHEQMSHELNLALNSIAGGRNMALLLALSDGQPHRPTEVDSIYKDSTVHWPEKPATRASRTYAGSQLRSSDSEVILGINDPDVTGSYYELLQFGKEKCAPLAARVAKLCKEYGIAPVDLVGYRSTARTDDGFDQPFARLIIYKTILERNSEEPLTVDDLAKLAGIDHRVAHNHMPSLLRSGIFVGFEGTTRKRYTAYKKAVESDATAVEMGSEIANTNWSSRKKSLANRVNKIIEASETPITVESIRDIITSSGELSDYFRSQQTHKQNESINEVLVLFEKCGILEKDSSRGDDLRLETIALTVRGKEIITKYIDIVNNTLSSSDEYRCEGKLLAKEIVKDVELMGWLIGIDIASGAVAVREKADSKKQQLIELFIVQGGRLLTGQIVELTGWKRRAAHNILRQLAADDNVMSEPVGRESAWSLTPRLREDLESLDPK